MDDGYPFPAKMTLVHGRALLTSWENLVLVVNLMLESKDSNAKQRRLLIRVLPKLQCYEADLGRSKDTEINQIKYVRQRCPQTVPIKEGWFPLPHFPRHASAGGSYFKCHLQLYFYLKFQEIPVVFYESHETLTATNMAVSFEFVTKLPSPYADWWIIPIAFDVSFRHKFHRGAEMYWRGPLFMSRRLLNAFSIDDVVALKSLYNKRPHGSPSDFTDVCTSETLDEHTGFFREAKRSFVLSHEETQRNSVIKKYD